MELSGNMEYSVDENAHQQEVLEFLQNIDFMRIGQAINHGQWQTAFLTLRRMEQKRDQLQMEEFKQNFAALKYSIQRKNTAEAKQILTLIVNKRARMRNQFSEKKD